MRDSFYDFGDIEVVVDDVSLKLLQGSTIDYKEDLGATGFVIDNPNKPIFNDMERGVQELLNQQVNPQINLMAVRLMWLGTMNVILFCILK